MAALPDTRMPGVYTQEVATLPPSVALVPTAVPVFIGYTEIAIKDGDDVSNKPVRIKSMRDYQDWFGGAFPQPIVVDVDDQSASGGPVNVRVVEIGTVNYRLYYALQLYFTNGGGPAYIISVGGYKDSVTPVAFTNGIDAAKKAKEITILVMPDAVALSDVDYGIVITTALDHCKKAINRVTIIDVDDSADDNQKVTDQFRFRMPNTTDQKKYGAAYYPFLKTTMGYNHLDKDVPDPASADKPPLFPAAMVRFYKKDGKDETIKDAQTKAAALETAKQEFAPFKSSKDAVDIAITEIGKVENANLKAPELKEKVTEAVAQANLSGLPAKISDAFKVNSDGVPEVKTKLSNLKIEISNKDKTVTDDAKAYKDVSDPLKAASATNAKAGEFSFATLDKIEPVNNLVYSKIKEAISQYPVVLPPSAAVAGVYVATDFSQGVWKAPANVSLAGVVSTTVEIDDDFHAALNVDAGSGKSVNAIRPYTGKGILIFGARTLAGNDLEWRYISVRRTFCFIEDAVGQAMQDFVFAPNTRDTWIKVKAMIGNFLNEIWKAGGLFGDSPDEAYQVLVGEPETMNDVDILEGRMIVDIKLRVARPAEFIILRYEHKFQANNN